jgi:Ser/Thr protein kinase RdoA (MazF antagonist)
MTPILDSDRLAVLAASGQAASGLRWVPVAAGGFSGAVVWRGEDEAGTPIFALKAWPAEGMTADRLRLIHGWMLDVQGLAFVPRVLAALDSATVVEHGGRVWDIERWMPGTADFHANPCRERLTAACAALARLHRAWSRRSRTVPSCPAVLRRLRLLDEWNALRSRFHAAGAAGASSVIDALRRGAEIVDRHADAARRRLDRWMPFPSTVQPCLCDVWHDHVLFTGNELTGIIDYGAMKEDHVAVDLARLLGDLAGDDDAAFAAGLAAYAAAGGILDRPAKFVRDLDQTGTLCGIIGWIRRTISDGRFDFASARIAARIRWLCSRFEPRPAAAPFGPEKEILPRPYR